MVLSLCIETIDVNIIQLSAKVRPPRLHYDQSSNAYILTRHCPKQHCLSPRPRPAPRARLGHSRGCHSALKMATAFRHTFSEWQLKIVIRRKLQAGRKFKLVPDRHQRKILASLFIALQDNYLMC